MLRVGVASIMQETNTWSPVACEIDDFIVHGLYRGEEIDAHLRNTNTEIWGALNALNQRDVVAVPLVRAWASSSGRVSKAAFESLQGKLLDAVRSAAPLHGVVLCLHGAMATDGIDGADAELVAAVRREVGSAVPISVSLDLHANVTSRLVECADVITGYRTYPHSDQAETGARAASLLQLLLSGERLSTSLAKRAMILPAEAQSTVDGPMAKLRRHVDDLVDGRIVDVSLFPVQPWLDVEELGFAVTVTATTGVDAMAVAEAVAERAWRCREEFVVQLYSPADAIQAARRSAVRPFLLSHSSDSPTAGATADSPAMIEAVLRHGTDLRVYLTVVDTSAVDACFRAGVGEMVHLVVGAGIDHRYAVPVPVRGIVDRIGSEPVRLEGPAFTGALVSIGRYAVVRVDRLHMLLTERPAPTTDPAPFRHVGLDPDDADVIVVRSAGLYKQAYPPRSAAAALTLDLDGASTSRLNRLRFERAPRPLYPVD